MSKIRYQTHVTTPRGYTFIHNDHIHNTAMLIAKILSDSRLASDGLGLGETLAFVHYTLKYGLVETTLVNGEWRNTGETSSASIDRLVTPNNRLRKGNNQP